MRPAAACIERSPDAPHGVESGRAAFDRPRAVPMASERPPRPILIAIVGVLVALGVVASVGWRFTGGSLFTIATPSMCPDLCVGTLVLDQPVHGPVHVGEVVTFRPPGTTTVYTHRVVEVRAGGSFKTAGDALGTVDPWTVPPKNVIGHVVFNVRGLGWLWRSLPWMAAALACMVIARRSIPIRYRKQGDLLFTTLLVVAPILVMRPLIRASVIAWHVSHGAVVMTVVNDGLLPAQFRVTGAATVSHVVPGQIVTSSRRPTRGESPRLAPPAGVVLDVAVGNGGAGRAPADARPLGPAGLEPPSPTASSVGGGDDTPRSAVGILRRPRRPRRPGQPGAVCVPDGDGAAPAAAGPPATVSARAQTTVTP